MFSESVEAGGKKVTARALVMDFAKLHDVSQWHAFQNEIEGLDVGVLGKSGVNCVVGLS